MYLFHFTVLLNSNFNCFRSFLSFSFDKVTTGMYSSASFIWNSNPVGGLFTAAISAKTQFFDQVKIIFISQPINGILRVLQKLLKCFSGITSSVSFLPALLAS